MTANDQGSAGVPESLAGSLARYSAGAAVQATDGPCGELTGMIVEPVAQKLTHLIVRSGHHKHLGHLVPLDLVESDGDPVRLRISTAEFAQLDGAEEIHLIPAQQHTWGYGGGQVYSWPHYGLGLVGGMGAGGMGETELGAHGTAQPLLSDSIPLGEVEVRRGDKVHATDGSIGSVEGLVIDPRDRHVTHVLLAEGHVWGRKQVAIPIGAASRVGDVIHVEMTKEQVEKLPPINLSSGPE